MLSIEDFARLGQVSVRMLRHYDAIVLKQLDPVRVATVRATASGVEEMGRWSARASSAWSAR